MILERTGYAPSFLVRVVAERVPLFKNLLVKLQGEVSENFFLYFTQVRASDWPIDFMNSNNSRMVFSVNLMPRFYDSFLPRLLSVDVHTGDRATSE